MSAVIFANGIDLSMKLMAFAQRKNGFTAQIGSGNILFTGEMMRLGKPWCSLKQTQLSYRY